MLCPFLDLSMTLTFDLYVGSGGGVSLVSFTHSFYLVCIWPSPHSFYPMGLVRDIYCYENYIYLRY